MKTGPYFDQEAFEPILDLYAKAFAREHGERTEMDSSIVEVRRERTLCVKTHSYLVYVLTSKGLWVRDQSRADLHLYWKFLAGLEKFDAFIDVRIGGVLSPTIANL